MQMVGMSRCSTAVLELEHQLMKIFKQTLKFLYSKNLIEKIPKKF